MSQKTRIFLSAVAAACAVLSTAVLADDTVRTSLRPSRAVQLSDAELDAVYAGQVIFMEQAVINNGNAQIAKGTNHIHCVNCVPFGNGGKTVSVHIVQNPAQTVIHCVRIAC